MISSFFFHQIIVTMCLIMFLFKVFLIEIFSLKVFLEESLIKSVFDSNFIKRFYKTFLSFLILK